MAREKKGELVVVDARFDYSPLEEKIAENVRLAAERIRQTVKRTIEDIIAVGTELLSVKEALPHGQFGPWLKAEFGWTDRTAQNFMLVSERFGKTEIISDLKIEPTAAYLLAAPSAPDEARQAALSVPRPARRSPRRWQRRSLPRSEKSQDEKGSAFQRRRFLKNLRQP